MSRITQIPTPMRVWLWRGFSLLIAIAILFLVLSMVDWESFRVLLGRLSPLTIGTAFACYVLLNTFRSFRYITLLERADIRPLAVFPTALYHNFLVRLLPFKLGEVTYIVLMRSRHNVATRDGVSSLFGSRLFELLVIVLVAAVALLLSGSIFADQTLLLVLLIPGSIFAGVLGFYFAGSILRQIGARLQRYEKLSGRVLALADSFERLRKPAVFSRALFWSLCTYSCSFAVNLVLLQGAGVAVDPARLILIVSLGMFATAFPFNISGFGAVELSWAFGLVNLAGYESGEAVSIGLMLNGLQLIFAALLGLAGYGWLQLNQAGKPVH